MFARACAHARTYTRTHTHTQHIELWKIKLYKLTNAVNTRVPVAIQLTRLHGVTVGLVAEFTLQLTAAVVVKGLQLCAIRIRVFAVWIGWQRFTGYI